MKWEKNGVKGNVDIRFQKMIVCIEDLPNIEMQGGFRPAGDWGVQSLSA